MENQVKQQARAAQFERFKTYAIEKGGALLSTEYIGSNSKLEFRCAAGHTFASAPGNMWHKKTWCKRCSAAHSSNQFMAGRDFLAELQDIARQRGGVLLSPEYIRSDVKLRFACADGHEWDSRPNDVRRGTWCPSCANKTEGMVRRYLECRFGQPMPSRRLPWLVDQLGKQRVLDGYSEVLKLAFEYHGVQHFEHTKFFHTEKTLEQQQDRDAFVREACAAAGVTLLEISSLPDGYTQTDFVAHLDAILGSVPSLPPEIPGGLEQFLAMPERISKLTEVQSLAQSLGGKCLSTKFISTNSKLTWECAKGHTWDAIPKTVKKGHWCPYCSNCRRVSPLEDLHKLAQEKGGVCHSTEYINNATLMKFTCAHGHDFESAPTTLWDRKSWCPVCGGNRVHKPLERLQRIAQSKGGTLLSTTYVNDSTKVEMRCGEGHQWSVTPRALVHYGHWCQHCAARAKALQTRAERKGKQQAMMFAPARASVDLVVAVNRALATRKRGVARIRA
jgi:thiol-disulfide isomerase/thioredoxin